jgi:hypothetical protein
MVANGKTIAQMVAEVEVDIRREREQEERAHRERLEAELAAVNEKLAKLTAPPPLRRRDMSAKSKSDFIFEHGLDKYQELPW